MNADSIFQIGKDHTVCEDYALTGINKGITYAIVCDGCSASADVDFGARIMALSAREILLHQVHNPLSFLRAKEFSVADFGNYTIDMAQKTVRMFPTLNPQTLDTTLLIAWVKENMLTVYMFGDGVFVHRMADGTHKVHIHLTSGAPDYLSYQLDPKRRASYDLLPNNNKVVEVHYVSQIEVPSPSLKPFDPYSVTVPVKEGESISLISDGINSFRKPNNEVVDWKDLVDEFTGFKNFEGQFVLRRIAAFKRKMAKENWHHLDDISIASIVI